MPSSTPASGFTLLELALVLTIIALIIGGITVGRSLVSNSGVRSLIADIERYESAVNSFQDKYNGLPGDIANATSYWGTDPDGCTTNTNRVPKTATCNGDGNGQLGNNLDETFHAWQQLADAGLISGSFTGLTGAGGAANAVIGENVPAGKKEGVGFSFSSYLGDGYPGNASHNAADYGNATMILGGENGFGDLTTPILMPVDAWTIDNKLDDGEEASGRITALLGASFANCISAPDYNLSYTTAPACVLLINITG